MREELLKGLTEEQIAKVKACKNREEILKVVEEEGIELTDEQLEAVSGGCWTTIYCPRCGSSYTEVAMDPFRKTVRCLSCDYIWYPRN